jgi:hypothetical protein
MCGGPSMSHKRCDEPVYRAGVYPDGLVYAEGRAAAIADGSRESHRLASVSDVALAARQVVGDLGGLGLELDGVVEVGRLDLASELLFDDGRDGLALLHGLARVDLPWLKRFPAETRYGVESVEWRTLQGSAIVMRGYDKGLESKTAGRGERVRLERQSRKRKGRALAVAKLATEDLRALYLGRELRAIAEQARPVTMCSTPDAIELVNAMVAAGDVSRREAEGVLGFLVGGRQAGEYARRTWYRRWGQLRQYGIALDDLRQRPVEIPVARYVDAMASAWAVAA